ncbi:polyphosphate kinase 2 family protein [Rubrolithibacter danxiaensis]|uniref:polyphosphate kinase 2 family protein n=1 Tax=Rubrolithibacter danxiaensis TaxID=3390805 RepID=UPI003BF7BAD5
MESIRKMFEITENTKIAVSDYDSDYSGQYNKENSKEILNDFKEELKDLQEKLFATKPNAVLIILQAMDAAGKDSAIEHVMGGINPMGCKVHSFKQPTQLELEHDFLWRHYIALPERGIIGIHNRSHYENVLVCKVHPELVLQEAVNSYKTVEDIPADFWEKRYESIRNFEKHLVNNGTLILKFFLHVSKKEQKERFLERIEDPAKNWKFSAGDLEERKHWKDYMEAYEKAISETATKDAPWYIIPADKKWFARIAIISILVEKMKTLDLNFPRLSEKEEDELKECKRSLLDD